MKKIVQIITSILIFVMVFVISTVLNMELLIKENNIKSITNKIDYINLVNVSGKKSEIKNTYDNIYLELEKEKISTKAITDFYNSKFFKNSMYTIIYNNINYLIFDKHNKIKIEDLIKDLSNNEEIYNKVLYNFINLDTDIKYTIDMISVNTLNIIRFLFTNIFKIVLILGLIISVMIEYFVSKEKVLRYVFIPTLICGVFEIIIAVLLPIITNIIIDNNFINLLLEYFVDSYASSYMLIAIITLFISVLYLAIDQRIIDKNEITLKPRLKIKKI